MAGYSGTPLADKLGIKDGALLCLINPPAHYLTLLAPLSPRTTTRVSASTDLIHVFTASKADLARRLTTLRARIKPEAAIWVSWPKKASKVATDITEDTIREVALPIGLVDVKVCAVDETWSGLKLVIRKELRPKIGVQ
jgi:hypothetical protein